MAVDSINNVWFLEKFDLIRELPFEARMDLDKCAVVHNSYKREIIYFENSNPDYIYFLKKGRVKISKISSEGKETTLYIVQPGEVFGETAIMSGEKRNHRAEALDEILLCRFEKTAFVNILNSYSELSRRIYKRIGDRLQTVEQKLADLVFRGSEDRIVGFLVEVGKPHLKVSVDEAFIKPFFTHEEIAHLTATSRQTVTTVLNDLKKQGLIQFWRNKMYIKEYSALEARLKKA